MSSRRPLPIRQQGWEPIAIAALSAAFGMGLLLWATGELSGVVATGDLPGVGMSQMGKVVIHLFDHLANPKLAWPHGARVRMSGPLLFYFVLVALTTAAGAALLGAYRVLRGSLWESASSSWASLNDLRPLIVKHPGAGRLVLGRVKGKLVAAEEAQSVIVLGPTQSMKTSGIVIPAILEWPGPVLATSIKSDLLRHTIDLRRRLGEVRVYDPTHSSGSPRATWSPLASCLTWHGAQRTASWMTGATGSGSTGLSESEFWYAAAAKLLAPLLFAAARTGRTIADVVRWVNLQEEKEVLEALEGAEPAAIDAAKASFAREGRQKSSIYTTAETVLAAYEDPVVAASAQGCEISPKSFLERGSSGTIYVVSPSHEQRRLRPLFETLLHTIITYAFELANDSGRPLDPPLLVVLDEAANIAPLRDLDTLASTAASHGIQLVSVFQDLAQVKTRYGDRGLTVANNHRAKVILSGVSDTETLEYASRLLGDEEVLQSSVTRGAQGNRSTTESTTLRTLAPANVLRAIRPGEGILVYGHLPPARLHLRPWFKEKRSRPKES
jgi:type IV secretion system protein VirD4